MSAEERELFEKMERALRAWLLTLAAGREQVSIAEETKELLKHAEMDFNE